MKTPRPRHGIDSSIIHENDFHLLQEMMKDPFGMLTASEKAYQEYCHHEANRFQK